MDTVRSSFGCGEPILYRELDQNGQLIDVKPVTVAEDSEARLALWLPLGTPAKKPELRPNRPGKTRDWVNGSWALVDSIWQWAELLVIVRPGDCQATWVRWSAVGEFLGWYVNLQSKLIRTRLGFDFRDHQLDIVVEPDRCWKWKDRDELDLSVSQGRMTPEAGRAVRKEGKRAVVEIERGAGIYSEGWENWRPDASLPRPYLPADWDDLSMYG